MGLLLGRSALPGWVGCVPQGAQATLACVQRSPTGQPPRVHWLHTEPWAAGADATGTAASPATGALKHLRRSHQLQRHPRVLVLQRPQYQLLPMEAPEVPREDWAEATRWRLKDLVDFDVAEASVDVLAVPTDPQQRRTPQLLAVAAPHAQLQALARAADEAGLPWTAIDVAETALRNLSALVAPAGRAQALLQVGPQQATLVITHGDELLMARHLDLTQVQLAQEASVVRDAAFDRIGLELQRTLDGFERLFSHVALARLLVTPVAGAQALCQHVRELLYVPVELLTLVPALDLTALPQADEAQLAPYLLAIGAALREDA